MTTRRDIRATETAAATSRAAGSAGAGPACVGAAGCAQDREALIALVRALARDAARADHSGRGRLPE
ncbi:MAG: hypothetical protein COB97_07085 [Paracoccus sp.]|nr:MAG: hypothetical protein COB97_07085 [Paracoccus sp. (in: a-proteobacteria)]